MNDEKQFKFFRGAVVALAIGFVGLGYNQLRARADGIPAMRPLTYAGTLEEGGGPVTGTRNIRLTLWDTPSGGGSANIRCITTTPAPTQVNNGRFQIVLDEACVPAVRSTPDLWLEVEVNGAVVGNRTKLSAVPFAVEANRANELTPAAANSLVPTGTVVAFAGTPARVPAGWLLCDGRSVTRAMYPALFDAIGTAHGGDGTNFNLPDYRGRFLRGVDSGTMRDPDRAARTAANPGGNTGDAVGTVEGGATALPLVAFQSNAAGAHSHSLSTAGEHQHDSPTAGGYGAGPFNTGLFRVDVNSPANRWSTSATSVSGAHSHSVAAAGEHGHTIASGGDRETRPVNAAVNYIIKS